MTDPFESFDLDINDDVNDSGSVDTAVKEAVKAVEEQKPEPPKTQAVQTTEEPEPTPDAPETSKEEDLKGYSKAALYALHFQKEKGLFPEDLEIKKDLTEEEFVDLLEEAALKLKDKDKEKLVEDAEAEAQRRLSEKGMTEEHLTYIQQIMNGADPRIVSKVAQYRSWADAELEGEEDMEAVVRAGLRLQLSNNPNADDLIEAYMEKNVTGKGTDVLQEQSAKFQDYIGKVADYLEAEDTKRVEAQRAAAEQAEQKFSTDVEQQVQTGFFGIELKKPQQKELIDYMTKKTEVIEIDTPQGKRKVKVTKEEADRRQDALDMKIRVLEAYQRKTRYTKLVNAAHQTASNKFLKSIKGMDDEPRNNNPTVLLPTSNGGVDFEIEI